MHAWVFRNRARLRLIYGPAPAPTPRRPRRAVAPAGSAPRAPEDAGTVLRRARYVLMKPMPRRP